MLDANIARALIDRAIERHGGAAGFEPRTVTLTPRSLTGALPFLKGHGRTFPLPRTMELQPLRARAVFTDYPSPGMHGVFDSGLVALGDEPPRAYRSTFDGLAKYRRWSPTDALYFFGYALTYYHAMPWSLRDAEPLALRATRRSGAAHALTVRFPPSVHTHSAVQTIYFDDSGLIVRHDYVADVVGRWARGAHLWSDFATVNGFPIACRRKVLARIGAQEVPMVVLDARFGEPAVV